MLHALKQRIQKLGWIAWFRLHKPARPAIGLVVSSFDKGGLEQVVLNLYRGYLAAGRQVYLLVEENILGPMAQQVDPERLLVFNRDEDTFLHLCRQHDIRVLHYHYNTYMMHGVRLMGFRVLYTIHNIYTWKSDAEMLVYGRLLDRCADSIVAVSGFVRDYFCRRTGLPTARVEVIPNGVETEELLTDSPLPFSRESLGYSPEEVVFAFIASYHPVKHHLGMIGVMEQLAAAAPRIRLLLLGNQGDPACHAAFQQALAQSPAKDAIRCLPYLPHSQVGAFLRSVPDVFLLPTLQEGCSNAVLEALCCGLPLVLTDVGNAREVKELAPASCLVVPPAWQSPDQLTEEKIQALARQAHAPNGQALADAMMQMARELPQAKAAAQAAAQKALPLCGCAEMTRRYLALMG